ncbi:general secretion pathway protein GspB [Shewanella nanhaiensis]|uniref:General secretion pathway protein GspB n=1 Tax=Shewanella nanhaiensis TaxID=2864872 RepID=A0ABS7E1Z3_9GAMM|nr:general secretion pathway protein GspB [Shewanella nanhaiensis]MBW8183580.1 general secretion pathway protein GspB [Shewanella nanhaiensis]
MSILLDAVTRAKQQDADINLDPVLTPRAQYEQLSRGRNRGVLLLLSLVILSLLVVITWLVRDQSTEVTKTENQSQQVEPILFEKVQEIAVADESSASVKNGIQLAGKVALPIAESMPVRYQAQSQPQTQPRQAVREHSQRNLATSSVDDTASEPIILGANANHKGQELLNSLKYQVDSAAHDLGMTKSQVLQQPEQTQNQAQPQVEEETRNYQSEGNLLAAFEAALKEVEVNRSVATPVTQKSLDPIPTPKQDTLPSYGQLPAGLQLQVPEFNINAHVYSSDPNNRWLNVDGAELQQGDSIGGKLEIVEIRPRDVVLAIQGTEFKVPAI